MNKEPDRNPRKALGKGISALLPSRQNGPPSVGGATPAISPAATRDFPEHFEEFQNIPLDQISPSEEQPRNTFDMEKLMELSQSIRANGLLQPITVYKVAPQKYRLIAGERRWRAAALAELKEIPALVRSVENHQLLELALIENIQREDLNPVEIATAFYRLTQEHGLSHEDVAQRTGKDRSTVTNFLRLLKLSPYVRNELVSGTISVGHARALLNIADQDAQARVCKQIISGQLSVRQTEALIKEIGKTRPQSDDKKEAPAVVDPNIRAALEEMEMALGTRVKIIAKSGGKGRLEIEYYSQEDLDRIYAAIVRG